MPKENDFKLPILDIKDGQIYLNNRLIPYVLKYNLNVEGGKVSTIDIKVIVDTKINPAEEKKNVIQERS